MFICRKKKFKRPNTHTHTIKCIKAINETGRHDVKVLEGKKITRQQKKRSRTLKRFVYESFDREHS